MKNVQRYGAAKSDLWCIVSTRKRTNRICRGGGEGVLWVPKHLPQIFDQDLLVPRHSLTISVTPDRTCITTRIVAVLCAWESVCTRFFGKTSFEFHNVDLLRIHACNSLLFESHDRRSADQFIFWPTFRHTA